MSGKCAIVLFVFVCIFHVAAYAADSFKLTIEFVIGPGGDYYVYREPVGKIIRASSYGYSMPFKIVLKNVTSSTQSLVVGGANKGLGLITFEITDENGNSNVVTKKIDASQSTNHGYNYLAPGKTKEFMIALNEQEWDNVFKLARQGAAKLTARASYKNGPTVIYSGYYTILPNE